MWKINLCLVVVLTYFIGNSEEQHNFTLNDCTKGPQESGAQCNAYFLVWSWVDEKSTCEEKIYGGCRKTPNNFPTREECLAVAGPICKRRHFTKEDCIKGTEEEEPPHCMAKIQVWHWNDDKKICEKAIYGGCHPTRNNFGTKSQCLQVAKPVCTASYN